MDSKTIELLNEWRGSATDAIETLKDFQSLMEKWQSSPPDEKEFMAMIKTMSEAGLEQWIGWHPLDIDKLAEKLGVD